VADGPLTAGGPGRPPSVTGTVTFA
jgi:hypothetical protein